MNKKIKTFTFPGEEASVERIMNNPGSKVISQQIVPCPREGIVLCVLQWEEDSDDSFEQNFNENRETDESEGVF